MTIDNIIFISLIIVSTLVLGIFVGLLSVYLELRNIKLDDYEGGSIDAKSND